MNDSGKLVHLSLISHTNAGKTTLARTLLGQDIGEVRDAAHVTDNADAYPMLQTADGKALMLWDTPGFGDTARLLRRLKLSGNPIGWLLTQVWDRYLDRPFWHSQQAVRNARDHADVVLYLINAAEDPADAGYVDYEMEILSWIDKPVVLLLNQMGAPSGQTQAEEEKWRVHLQRFAIVRGVLTLDAFARCWVQEDVLLRQVAGLLEANKQATMADLSRAWRQKNLARFDQSMHILAAQLAGVACDREQLDKKNWQDKMRQLVSIRRSGEQAEQERKRALMAKRLDVGVRGATDELIRLHGLEGKAADEVLRRLRSDYESSEPVQEGLAAMLGGLATGAATGLAADLAAGGLTFGGGMLIGGIAGALGAGGLSHGYNMVRGESAASVRWSEEFFEGMVRAALLRYLAVAHFGRGRGDYAESEHPLFWQTAVTEVVESQRTQLHSVWEQGRSIDEPDALIAPMEALVRVCVINLLTRFYPEAIEIFESA